MGDLNPQKELLAPSFWEKSKYIDLSTIWLSRDMETTPRQRYFKSQGYSGSSFVMECSEVLATYDVKVEEKMIENDLLIGNNIRIA